MKALKKMQIRRTSKGVFNDQFSQNKLRFLYQEVPGSYEMIVLEILLADLYCLCQICTNLLVFGKCIKVVPCNSAYS